MTDDNTETITIQLCGTAAPDDEPDETGPDPDPISEPQSDDSEMPQDDVPKMGRPTIEEELLLDVNTALGCLQAAEDELIERGDPRDAHVIDQIGCGIGALIDHAKRIGSRRAHQSLRRRR